MRNRLISLFTAAALLATLASGPILAQGKMASHKMMHHGMSHKKMMHGKRMHKKMMHGKMAHKKMMHGKMMHDKMGGKM